MQLYCTPTLIHLLRRLLMQHDEPFQRSNSSLFMLAQKLYRQYIDRGLIVDEISLIRVR